MRRRRSRVVALLAVGVAGLLLGLTLRPAVAHGPSAAPPGYVIDVADADASTWHTAVNAVTLVHATYPSARMEIVAHGPGIQMLLASSAVAPDLEALVAGGGVELAACANAMRSYGITADQLVARATVVPAGVVEVARREAQGYRYMNAS